MKITSASVKICKSAIPLTADGKAFVFRLLSVRRLLGANAPMACVTMLSVQTDSKSYGSVPAQDFHLNSLDDDAIAPYMHCLVIQSAVTQYIASLRLDDSFARFATPSALRRCKDTQTIYEKSRFLQLFYIILERNLEKLCSASSYYINI